MSFVGYTQQPISDTELQKLLGQLAQNTSYYFLRWPHAVSGIWQYLPSEFPHPESLKGQFPSPEGQLFNAELELRWKRRNQQYDVLLLQRSKPEQLDGFEEIPGKWKVCDRNANFYRENITQFPKGFNYPNGCDIQQRYFIDANTSTVHFVALTLGENDAK